MKTIKITTKIAFPCTNVALPAGPALPAAGLDRSNRIPPGLLTPRTAVWHGVLIPTLGSSRTASAGVFRWPWWRPKIRSFPGTSGSISNRCQTRWRTGSGGRAPSAGRRPRTRFCGSAAVQSKCCRNWQGIWRSLATPKADCSSTSCCRTMALLQWLDRWLWSARRPSEIGRNAESVRWSGALNFRGTARSLRLHQTVFSAKPERCWDTITMLPAVIPGDRCGMVVG